MPLGVLNNISAIYAENNLNTTQANLQNTLTQLSSGSRINSGADDAAGLSIANGLQANSSALTQSSSNATAGVGFLQVADGALSQVTNLLNRAVTLATEAGGGTLTGTQMSAADQEYQDILSQINTIGGTTEYNGLQVFSSDQTTGALNWAEVVGGTSANTAATSTASATAAALAGSAIVAGGSSAGVNATQGGTFANVPAALTWTAGGSGAYGVITTGPITNGSQLTGTFGFTPTASSGSPNAISVNLGTAITSTNLATQASQLQDAMNVQATGSANSQDYTVTVVNGNELQVGFGAHASTDNLTGFPAISATGSSAAAQTTGTYQLTGVNGDSLSGTLSLTKLTSTAAGTAANVIFAGQGTTSTTAAIGSGNTLSGSLVITSNSGVTGAGTATALSWGSNAGTYSASMVATSTFNGKITVGATGDTHAPYTIDLTGKDTSNVAAAITAAITTGGGSAADYTVGYAGGKLSIVLSAQGATDGLSALTVANDGTTPATQTPPTGTIATTVNLNGVTTANLTNVVDTALGSLSSDFTVGYSNGSLSIAANGTGTTAGITSLTLSGGLQQATSATTGAVALTPITLTGENTANLAATVSQAINGSNANPDYTVAYNAGTGKLSIGLTAQAATDNITGISWDAVPADAITQTAAASGASQASITYNTNELLGGSLTINQTVAGQAVSPVTVNLSGATSATGTNTDHSGADLISAINTALGNNAQYYTLTPSTLGSASTLTMSINAAGIAANVDSIGITNGTGATALAQSQMTEANITGSSAMGGFTLTSTGTGTNTPIVVNLAGESTTGDLVSALQTALGANYLVGQTPVALPAVPPPTTPIPMNDNLTIGVSAAGVAAGVTGFTITNATTNGFEQMSQPTSGVNVYTSDGTSTGSKNYNVTVGGLSDTSVGTSDLGSVLGSQITATVGGVVGTGGTAAGGSVGTSLTGTTLTSQAVAEAALQTVDDAISAVAYQRGQVGANINTLTAASNIASAEETNVQSAQNTITATDYASATSNMSKYEILTQTGISALAQANSTEQMVTKLLQ